MGNQKLWIGHGKTNMERREVLINFWHGELERGAKRSSKPLGFLGVGRSKKKINGEWA